MINTIILDIGQVLASFCWKDYLIECGYDEETIKKVSNATVLSKDWNELDRGFISQEELIALCCANDLSVTREIKTLFYDIKELVREYDYSAQFVKGLKENGYMVYILSNFGRNFLQSKENFEFMKYVDGGVISYEVNYIKPEPEIYEILINKYKINPAQAVFLDDKQENLDGAKPFGFKTIQVKEWGNALEELREFGVKV